MNDDELTREQIEKWRRICLSHWVADEGGIYYSHDESARQANALCDLALRALESRSEQVSSRMPHQAQRPASVAPEQLLDATIDAAWALTAFIKNHEFPTVGSSDFNEFIRLADRQEVALQAHRAKIKPTKGEL